MTTAYTDEPDDEPPGYERLPPQDLQAEQGVLGGMLLANHVIADVQQEITPASYYRPAHGIIHSAILDLWRRSEPADPITVGALLLEQGDLTRIGGPGYLHTLIQAVPTAANADYYAAIVRERAGQRALIETGTRLVQRGYDADQPEAALNAAVAELQALTASLRSTGTEREKNLDDMLEEFLADLDAGVTPTLPLPWIDLDRVLLPEPGDLIVVAGRPGMGKSVVMLDIARHVAIKCRMRARVASMEMSHRQLTQRLLAAEARVGLHKLRTQELTDLDRKAIQKAVVRIAGSPLVVDDSPAVPISRLRGRLRQLAAQDQVPAVLCVDYLQIMKAEAAAGANRTGEVDALARGLKELAQEFRMVVVAGAQLNRNVEQRTEKVPTLADLRESGQIEAEANSVVMLYRPDAYERDHARSGEIDLIVAKNRMGTLTTITAAFAGHYSSTVDMAQG
jgi:replicative DNA helicase